MNPGQLDRLLTLLRRTVSIDGAGAPVETWADCGQLWAKREKATGSESEASGTDRSMVSASYKIRYRHDLATETTPGTYRVRVDGRTFNVVSALEDEREPRRAFMILGLAYTQGEPTLTSVPFVA